MRSLPPAPSAPAFVIGLHGLTAWILVGYLAFDGVLVGGWSGAHMALACFGYALARTTLQAPWPAAARSLLPLAGQGIVALLGALLVGALWMLPADYALLGGQATGTVLQVLNHWPGAAGSGEDTALGAWPLGVLWPVSVMAQYTLLWAALHYSLLRHAPPGQSRPGSWLLAVLALASLAAGALQLGSHALHTHAWECLLGSALAWWQHHHRAAAAQESPLSARQRLLRDASAVGLLLIYLAFWQAPAAQGAASIASRLTPVLGVLVLLAAGPQALVNRHLLAWRPLVLTGAIAVPWVLWCAVLLGMAHALSIDPVPGPLQAVLVLVGLGLALGARLLWHRTRIAQHPLACRAVGLGALVVAVLGLLVQQLDGLPARFDALAMDTDYQAWPEPHDAACRALAPADTAYDFCQFPPVPGSAPAAAHAPAPGPQVMLIGDTAANQYLPGLAAQGVRAMHLGMQGCPPLLDAEVPATAEATGCAAESINRAMALAIALPDVHTIVLAGHFSPYFQPTGQAPALVTHDGQGQPLTGNAEVFARTLERTLQAVSISGKRLVLVQETPVLPFDPAECIPPLRGHSDEGQRTARKPCAVEQATVQLAQKPAREAVAAITRKEPQVQVFDPFTVLCDGQLCHAAQEGHLLYRDARHLSQAGSARVAQALLPLLQPQQAAQKP